MSIKIAMSGLAVVIVILIFIISFIPNVEKEASDLDSTKSIIYKNIRIELWQHSYEIKLNYDMKDKIFYYNTIYTMLIEAGFDSIKSKVYAEIPTIESNWNNMAESKSGAIGLWQILPSTAGDYGITKTQLFNPVINTNTAIKHLQYLDKSLEGDIAKVLFAYNGGLEKVKVLLQEQQTQNIWLVHFTSRETHEYASKVLGAYFAYNKN